MIASKNTNYSEHQYHSWVILTGPCTWSTSVNCFAINNDPLQEKDDLVCKKERKDYSCVCVFFMYICDFLDIGKKEEVSKLSRPKQLLGFLSEKYFSYTSYTT